MTCAIDVPTDPALLKGPPVLRPSKLIPWGPLHVRALHHTHTWQFSPSNRSDDGWSAAIRASQFGNCRRFMLVEDDLSHAGLGFTAKLWIVALLIAMRDNRVLIEVRAVHANERESSHRNQSSGIGGKLYQRPRWCDRAPFTLQCLYLPWTHCTLPANRTISRLDMTHPSEWPHYAPYVRTGLNAIHRHGKFWFSARSPASHAAGRFLFRPRPWVVSRANCVMGKAGLKSKQFISLHVRHSVEKSEEGDRLGVKLPSLPMYEPLLRALKTDLHRPIVFVQTASPLALGYIATVCHRNKIKLSFTNNTRSEHDSWGGWIKGSEMEQAAVAAINAHISSKAQISISPVLSIWTHFLDLSFGEDGEPLAATSLCCPPWRECRRMMDGVRSFRVTASAHLLRTKGELNATRAVCKERVAASAVMSTWVAGRGTALQSARRRLRE